MVFMRSGTGDPRAVVPSGCAGGGEGGGAASGAGRPPRVPCDDPSSNDGSRDGTLWAFRGARGCARGLNALAIRR